MEPKIMIIVFLSLWLLVMCVLFIITKIKYLDLKEEMNRIKAESQTREKLIEAGFKLQVKCKQQSRRIAELIELCNKLQPDLVEEDSDYAKKCMDSVNKRLKFNSRNAGCTDKIYVVDKERIGATDNHKSTSFETLSAMYDKVTTCAHDGMMYVDAHTKVDFEGLKKYLNRK